jgi:hypothetical protein
MKDSVECSVDLAKIELPVAFGPRQGTLQLKNYDIDNRMLVIVYTHWVQ